ncbi:NADH:ubiquinone oxidoreductase subunit NDUFA12 [soil metagenome]
MPVKNLLTQIFSWWNGQTLGTRFFTWRSGQRVGQDELGNVYYRAPSAIPDSIPERRWVVYKNYAEASSIPPGWHGWMHHRGDELPAHDYPARSWEAPHEPNHTGTALAYRPPGSIVGTHRPAAPAPDYQAWTPG